MKRSIALLIVLLIILLPACTAREDQPTGILSASPGTTPTAAALPGPITRTDIPAYFTPGLETAGVQPAQAYTIGVIAGGAFEYAAMRDALDTMRSQYEDSFGVTVLVQRVFGHAAQLGTAQSMIDSGIDFLIVSADEDCADIGGLCSEHGIPYITMNCRAGTPGTGSYLCAMERDDYLIGVLTGLSIADKITEKYGKPRGNIGEITGAVSSETSVLRSAGLRRALSAYPDIRVVCSVTTEGDTAYHAAINVMKAYRAGELDGIVATDDAAAMDTLQAAVNYNRSDLVGFIWSAGGTKDGLTGVWYGQLAQTVEITQQTGMMALEYALQYLEGRADHIPPVVCSMTRAFHAETQQQKDAVAATIAQMDKTGSAQCMDSEGDYALFAPDERLAQIYPKHYYEYDDIAAFVAEYGPYTTQDAVYPAPGQG